VKKFLKIILLVIVIIISAIGFHGYFTQANANQQDWCKDKLEIISLSYQGAFYNQLTEEMQDELKGWIDTYFQAYNDTFEKEWNSNIVIWQMYVPQGTNFTDLSLEITNEGVEEYNKIYDRNFKIDNPSVDVGEYISDTFLMQNYLLTYTPKINPLRLCKAWEELN